MSKLSRPTLSLALIVLVALVLLGLASAPETNGRAPAPAPRKDKYDQAIDRGLAWLALHQAEDGHWGLHDFNKHAREKPLPEGKVFTCDCEASTGNRTNIAATAFGLLPFLAAGYGPKTADKKPDYRKTVDAGLKYLLAKQNEDGSFGSVDMYAHALACRVLCEAYALTKDEAFTKPAQKALDFIVQAQDPDGGGWRYQPRQAGDLSVTGWQMAALKRGQMAGLEVPKKTLTLAEKFLDSCEPEGKGGFGYMPGQPESITMTAVGLLCREYSGIGPRSPSLLNGVSKLKKFPPSKEKDDLYYLYYANQVMFHLQGDLWRYWDRGLDEDGKKVHVGMRDSLLDKQDKGDVLGHAHQQGSWGGSQGGRIMATSLSLLILQQSKQTPIYRRDIEKKR
jgi:hypothetical protein